MDRRARSQCALKREEGGGGGGGIEHWQGDKETTAFEKQKKELRSKLQRQRQ